MRYIVLLLILLLPATDEAHRVYLPIAMTPPDKFGIAWPYVGYQDISQFNARYYQGWTISFDEIDGMTALPHIPCPYGYWPGDPDVDFLQLLETRLADYQRSNSAYDGILLVLNEPDLESQCLLSPQEAIEFYRAVAIICPSCQLTFPQVSHQDYWAGWQWLGEFLALYRAGGYYPPIAYGAIHSYVWQEPPHMLLDSYGQLLDGYGIVTQGWIVSEWGACTPESLADMYRAYEADSRVLIHLYFAPWFHEGNCTNLFTDFDGNGLTAVGDKLYRLRN